MALFCGIDFGTTNTKAVLLDKELSLLGRITIPVKDFKATGNELIWYANFKEIIQSFKFKGFFDGNRVICSITSQGSTFVFLDEKFRPLVEPVSWMDSADQNTVDSFNEVMTSDEFYKITGWQPDPWLAVFKIKDRLKEKGVLEKLKYVSTVPEYIHAQLSGDFVTDMSNAQITGICDFTSGEWDSEILDWLGLPSGSLPKIAARNEIIIAQADVLGVNITFTTSSHDQYAAIQAAGLNAENDILLGTGTAWVLNGISGEPVYDLNDFTIHPGRDIINDRYGYIMTLGSIGSEFDTLLADMNIDLGKMSAEDWTKPGPVKDYMDEAAGKVAAGFKKLGLGSKVKKIIMSGGATANPYWPQAIADTCGVVVKTVEFSEFTAYGAAMSAVLASGYDKTKIGLPGDVEVAVFKPE